MHCRSCDCELTDKEAVHKDETGNYPDMCFDCLYDWWDGQDQDLDLHDYELENWDTHEGE